MPADELARWVKILFWATLAVTSFCVISGILQSALLNRAGTVGITMSEALANDAREGFAGILQILTFIATAVVFLIWFYRVRKNVEALGGRSFKYAAGWAIGGFFVPFLNFVYPSLVMAEVWHGSDPSRLEADQGPDGPALRNKLPNPLAVFGWWGLYILSSLVAWYGMRGIMFNAQPSLPQLIAGSNYSVLSDLLRLPSAALAISLVNRISAWQKQRQARLWQVTAAEQVAVANLQLPAGPAGP